MADENVTTKLQIDITDFKKGLQDANRYVRLANSEFDAATAGMDKWSQSSDGLKAKLTQLNKTLDGQEDALEIIRAEYERTVKEQGENSKGAQELAIKMNKQEAAIKKTAASIDRYSAQLDEMERTSDDAGDESQRLGDNLGEAGAAAKKAGKEVGSISAEPLKSVASAAANAARSLASMAAKAVVTGIKAVGAASAGLVTAFLATSETSKEWIGNMNKLEASAKEAGRSTDAVKKQFTEFYGILGDDPTLVTTTVNNLTAIGMSEKNLASITNSMAGIWAKYGDSIPLDGLAESINETSRVAQVTGNLADALNWAGTNEDDFNTKLAACSTEQERQQLIVDTLDDAYGKLGQTYKEQNAAIIENNEATAKMNEAMAQIGRVAMPIMTTFKQIGAAILTDLLPNVKALGTAFSGVLNGSPEAATKMGEAVSGMLTTLGQKIVAALPTILTIGASVVVSLVQGIVNAAPQLAAGVAQIVQYIIAAAPQLMAAGVSMVTSLVSGVKQSLPSILEAAGQMVYNLLNGIVSNLPTIMLGAIAAVGGFVNGLQQNLPTILEKGKELIGNLGKGIRESLPDLVSQALDVIMNFATTLYDNAPTIIETGFGLLSDLVQGIMNALPVLLAKAPEIISKFANIINDNFPTILLKGAQLIGQIILGILKAIPSLIANAPKIIRAIVDVWEAFNWINLGQNAIKAMKDGVLKMVGSVKAAGQKINDSIVNIIQGLPAKLQSLGTTATTWFKNGIVSMAGGVRNAGSTIFDAIVNIIKNLPQMLLNLGKQAITWMGDAVLSGVGSIKSAAQSIFDSVVGVLQGLPGKMLDIGKDLVRGLWNGISDMTGWVIGKIQGFGDSVLSGLKKFFKIGSPSKVMRDEVGKWLPAGMAEGIEKNTKSVTKAMTSMAKDALGAANSELSGAALGAKAQSGAAGGGQQGGTVYNFYQTINSPKALSRAEIYRQTKNQLRFATQS